MDKTIKKVCVFCGSSYGNSPIYKEAAVTLGKAIAESGYELVYGGGNVGLMGAIADAALEAGGTVTGVIPGFLNDKEVGHTGLSELIIVDSMHERKKIMAEMADGFIAMPGGIGTLEELAEIMTWVQLEIIQKPIGIYNVNKYFNGLINFLDLGVDQGFLKPDTRNTYLISDNAGTLLDQLANFRFSNYSIWQDLDRT